MITILTTLTIIISGMILSLIMWEKVNNNALTPWNHPLLLLFAFCFNWGMFAVMLLAYKIQNQTYNQNK